MYFHFTIGRDLPKCPILWNWTATVSYPSVTITYGILAITSLVFSIIIGFKYNSVKVFNRKIRTQNISNTMWILYYCALAFRGACNGVRYALEERHEESLDSVFFLSSLILHGITAFSLCLALNHQRKYRSSLPPSTGTAPPKENDPLLAKYAWFRKTVSGSETFFFFLFVIYLIFLYLQVMKSNNTTYEILFLCAFGVQRIPIVILVLMIVYGRTSSTDGPTKKSKVFLVTAAVVNVAGDIPLTIWSAILPNTCIFVIASAVDLIHLCYLASLILFFLFLRSEYLRNMEECIWTTVSQIQDTFDFRRF